MTTEVLRGVAEGAVKTAMSIEPMVEKSSSCCWSCCRSGFIRLVVFFKVGKVNPWSALVLLVTELSV